MYDLNDNNGGDGNGSGTGDGNRNRNSLPLERPAGARGIGSAPALPPAGGQTGVAASFRSKATRKRSVHLSLVLMSAAALAGTSGCGRSDNGESLNRDVYANMEACKADWGTPGDCEEIEPSHSATGSRSYYGPRYYSRSGVVGPSGYSTISRPGSRASGTVATAPARGGFGASSARHSGGTSHSSGG